MASSSRVQVGVLVTAITLLVCSLGVRHELKVTKDSIAAHRPQTQRAEISATRQIAGAARGKEAHDLPG